MVFNTADCDWNAIDAFNDSPEICVEIGFPFGSDERKSVFGAEDEMVMETKMSGRHEVPP
jgi:hypothetical protein